jgi:hypothetical protein
MMCPHCGCALPPPTSEMTTFFATPVCVECGQEFIIFKNVAMSRFDYVSGKFTGKQ